MVLPRAAVSAVAEGRSHHRTCVLLTTISCVSIVKQLNTSLQPGILCERTVVPAPGCTCRALWSLPRGAKYPVARSGSPRREPSVPSGAFAFARVVVRLFPELGLGLRELRPVLRRLAMSSSRPRATCIKVCLSPSDFSCIPSLPRSRDTFLRALLRRVTFTCRHNSSQTLVAAFT